MLIRRMPRLPEFLTTLRRAFRAHFFSFSLWLALFLVISALLASNFSGREPATVALDTGISVIRLALPVLAILLLQELVSREFDRKLYLASLTYPRPRHEFLIARIVPIAALLFFLLLALAALLAGTIEWLGHSFRQSKLPSLGLPYAVTILFIALDLLVVIAIGTLIAVSSITPNFVLIGTIGFMLVARSYSGIIKLLAYDSTLVTNAEIYKSSLNFLGYLLPDLAALDVRMIALYDTMQFLPADWPVRVFSAVAYATALFALSAWALSRKRFA